MTVCIIAIVDKSCVYILYEMFMYKWVKHTDRQMNNTESGFKPIAHFARKETVRQLVAIG